MGHRGSCCDLCWRVFCLCFPLRVLFHQFRSIQSFSCVQLFATPWTAARQASLSVINFCSLLKLISIESVMPFNHLIICHPLLLPPPIFPSIRVFSNESVLHIRWPKYWSFSFSISPSNEYSRLISFRMDWLDLLEDSQESSPTVQFSHSVVSDSLQPHGLQHARPTCPSPTPGIYTNSRPSGR